MWELSRMEKGETVGKAGGKNSVKNLSSSYNLDGVLFLTSSHPILGGVFFFFPQKPLENFFRRVG